MKPIILAGTALAALVASPTWAAAPDDLDRRTPAEVEADEQREILVEGRRDQAFVGTKTETPLIEVPQPLTVIPDDVYL
ncbi:outer membrane receptor protein involved in Fe transport, partial [Sphingomonas sp. SORGH_AS 879]|nr:outer membrane receptor protein involved in Fe transport [Sphingomonas sp. SORGH_AS_0879]